MTTALEEKETATQQALMSQEETTSKVTTLEEEINSLKNQLGDKETVLAQTQEALTAAQQNQQELKQLKATLDEKSTALDQATSKVEELTTVAATVAGLKENSTALAGELESSKNAIAGLEQKLSQLQVEIDALKTERDQLLKKTMDSDKDGVSDADDACPDTPEETVVDNRGCEQDSDKDGVVDRLDLCADTAEGVTVNAMGCEDNKSILLKGVTFEFGTANLTESAQQSLMTTATIIKESSPEQRFEVAGYTDSTGAPERNQLISDQRATAVRTFLINQGVQDNLLVAKGYGQENPIADNATRKGRAQNRRVELHMIME